jgi:hypothetical protein
MPIRLIQLDGTEPHYRNLTQEAKRLREAAATSIAAFGPGRNVATIFYLTGGNLFAITAHSISSRAAGASPGFAHHSERAALMELALGPGADFTGLTKAVCLAHCQGLATRPNPITVVAAYTERQPCTAANGQDCESLLVAAAGDRTIPVFYDHAYVDAADGLAATAGIADAAVGAHYLRIDARRERYLQLFRDAR